jgi:Rod binding domain-containing protein
MSTALPPIDPAFEPASVRNGSPAVQKAYASALSFESMLVQQLSQSLTESGGLGGEGEGEGGGGGEASGAGMGADPATSQLSSLLPQTLTNSVMSHGGLGLAQQLMGSLLPETASKVAPSGGVKA